MESVGPCRGILVRKAGGLREVCASTTGDVSGRLLGLCPEPSRSLSSVWPNMTPLWSPLKAFTLRHTMKFGED